MTPEQDKAEAVLRYCGYCRSWYSKPCGEGCVWTPDMPTVLTHPSSRDDVLEAEREVEIVKAVAEPLNAEISRLQAEVAELRQRLATAESEIDRLAGLESESAEATEIVGEWQARAIAAEQKLARLQEAIEGMARDEERAWGYTDDLQKSVGALTTGQAFAARLRALSGQTEKQGGEADG